MLKLRAYQEECIDAHFAYFSKNDGNPLMVLPTAAGKSVIQAAFLRDILGRWPGQRVLCLTHVKELIQQNYSKLKALWPEAPAGVYSAGLKRRDLGAAITFAGVQSAHTRVESFGEVNLVLVDECVERDTLVSGVPVQDIKPGDLVESFDHERGEVVMRSVLACRESISKRPRVVIRTESGEALCCTDNHPIWTEENGYQEASSVRPGQNVRVLRLRREVRAHRESTQDRTKGGAPVLLEGLQVQDPERGPLKIHEGEKLHVDPGSLGEGVDDAQENWPSSESPRWEGPPHDSPATKATQHAWERVGGGEGYQDGHTEGRRGDLVLGGPFPRGDEDHRGSGREFAFQPFAKEAGQEEGRDLGVARVLDVEIHESPGDGRSVYNLQVDREENFFADGVLTHNCHLIPKRGTGMHLSILAKLREANPSLKVIGYTATPYRMQGGLLHQGEGRIFTDIAYDLPVRRLIDEGYLSPLVSKAAIHSIDTSKIKTRAGEFVQGELEVAALEGDLVARSVEEAVSLSQQANRTKWLVFCCTVRHAHAVLDELTLRGITAAGIFGHTHPEERARILEHAKEGKITALVNVQVLTTGFDWPECDAIWFMRATQSTSLYVQILGRGMRIAPGKENALLLDYGGNVLRHGPVDQVNPESQGPAEGSKGRVCPECQTINEQKSPYCVECGHEFPPPQISPRDPSIDDEASDLDPLGNPRPRELSVLFMEMDHHQREGKPPCVKVSYMLSSDSRQGVVREFVCPEHGGYATAKFHQWWNQMGGGAPIPVSVDEALDRRGEIEAPLTIHVEKDGKYDRVTRREFAT